MMSQSPDEISPIEAAGGAPRWTIGIAVAAALHILGGLFLARIPPPSPPAEPVLMLELAPMPEVPQAEPEPQPEQPSVPEPEETPAPPDTVPPPDSVPPTLPDPPPAEVPPPEPPPEVSPPDPPPPPIDLPQVPLPPDPPVAAPPVRVPPPRPVKAPSPRPVQRAAPVQVPPPAAASAPPPAAPVLRTSTAAATADWRARLLAHLNRFKRYPAAAQMRRQQGVAYVRLTLLPNGSVQGVRLQTSAGVESLDEEALALIQRALPLPVPPDDDGRHELVVPIQFTLR